MKDKKNRYNEVLKPIPRHETESLYRYLSIPPKETGFDREGLYEIRIMIKHMTGCKPNVDINDIYHEVVECMKDNASMYAGFPYIVKYLSMVREYDLIEDVLYAPRNDNKSRYGRRVVPMSRYNDTIEKHRSCHLPSGYLELGYIWD